MADNLEQLEQVLPTAPPPLTRPARPEPSPGDIYPVYLPKAGEAARHAPWRWDDGDNDAPPDEDEASSSASQPDDVPRWNPRSGFMRTAAEIEAAAAQQQLQQQQPQASSSSSQNTAVGAAEAGLVGSQSRLGSGAAAATGAGAAAGRLAASASSSSAGAPPSAAQPTPSAAPPEVSFTSPSADAAGPLPAVSRNAILTSALGTGFWMSVLALCIRNFAQLNAAAVLGTDPVALAALLRWPGGFDSWADAALAVGAAAAVTGARFQLMRVWPELREATHRSNAQCRPPAWCLNQILTPLGWPDIVLVALASGIPEELLFRGAIIPATLPDWRGALISSAIFGLLHNNGGRNLAFAAWAGGVGSVYGAVYLLSTNIWVPAAAHVMANMASASIWKANAPEPDKSA